MWKPKSIQHVEKFSSLFKSKYVLDDDDRFVCVVCEQVRETELDIINHFLAHTEKRPVVCHHCLKGFHTNDELNEHLLSKHSNARAESSDSPESTIAESSPTEGQFARNHRSTSATSASDIPLKDGIKPHHTVLLRDLRISITRCDKMKSGNAVVRETEALIQDTETDSIRNRHLKSKTSNDHDPIEQQSELSQESSDSVQKSSQATKKRFSCNVCSYSTSDSFTLKRHSMIHTGERPFTCHMCSYRANRKEHLKRHLNGTLHFQADSFEMSQLISRLKVRNMSEREKPFKFKDGSYSAASSDRLTRHMTSHTDQRHLKCSECLCANARGDRLQLHLNAHSRVTVEHQSTTPTPNAHSGDSTTTRCYSCSHCTYSTSIPERIASHIRTHSGERPFRCDLCSYSFRRKDHLKRHMLRHTKASQETRECTQCAYTSTTRGDLFRHVQTHGIKTLSCPHCSYATVSRRDLTRHSTVHVDEKPFKCSDCPFIAARRNLLTNHQKVHRRLT